jgi:hypothetical protein
VAITLLMSPGQAGYIDFQTDTPSGGGIAGWTIRFQIRASRKSTVGLVTKTTGGGGIVVLDAALEIFRVNLDSVDTRDLSLGDYYFCVERVDVSDWGPLSDGVFRFKPPRWVAAS